MALTAAVPRYWPPATVAVLTAVTRPLALTVTTGMADDEPYVPTFEFTVASVPAAVTFAEPLNDGLVHVTSPVMAIVRPVAKVVAVVALPESAPLNVVVVSVLVDGL